MAGGPGGVGLEEDQPVMKILPAAFVIADAEDADAAAALLRLGVDEHAKRIVDERPIRERITDVVIDGSGGFAVGCERELSSAFVHRCLQHVKSNVKKESTTVININPSEKRMKDRELLRGWLNRIIISSKFSSPLAFHNAMLMTGIHPTSTITSYIAFYVKPPLSIEEVVGK